MTTAELHKILDDENKNITLKEYQEILFQLKLDIIKEQSKQIKGVDARFIWNNGQINAFRIALDLSEHIKDK